MTFSSNLKKYRIKSGLQQSELARLLKVAQSTIAMWETGQREPNFSLAVKLAKILGVSLTDLAEENQPLYVSNLVYIRKSNGLPAREMSALLSCSEKEYRFMENGISQLSVKQLSTIIEYFGISAEDFLNKDLQGGKNHGRGAVH